jgi:two-component system phosphate regulon sensor histidine kinase PhoR
MLAYAYGDNIAVFVLSTLLFFLASFFSISYLIKKYIIEKVRPIYNTIRDLPLSGKKMEEKSFDSNSLLHNVKYEVEEWAKTQLKEIERLKDLERYRKDFVGNVSH